MNDLDEAKDEVLMGIKKKRGVKDPDELKLVAYHEGGHTLVGLYTSGSHPIHKATIVPRGQASGVTILLPEKDYSNFTKEQLIASITGLMGGRVAEEIIFGPNKVSTGASSDFRSATKVARSMVLEVGMFPEVTSYVSYDDSLISKLSENEKMLIDQTVKKIINGCYENAKKILLDHKNELELLAKALLEYETLTKEEIELVIKGKPLPKKL